MGTGQPCSHLWKLIAWSLYLIMDGRNKWWKIAFYLKIEHKSWNISLLDPLIRNGHGQNLHGKQGLVAVAIGKIIENKSVEVWGDGSAIRDYIYIEDLANVFYLLINKDVCNETINLGSGRGYSVNDVLAFLKIISKVDFKIDRCTSCRCLQCGFRYRENETDGECDFDTNAGWNLFILLWIYKEIVICRE